MSATISSTCSMPIDSRTSSGATPAACSSSSVSWEWVAEAGWTTSDLASPILARCETAGSSSTKTGPGLPSGLEPEGEESAVVPLVIVAVLTGTTAVLRRRWLAALRDLGDRQVIIEGLGPVLAAMIRSRSRSVSDLARADTLDQRHTGRDAELQPAVRKRACR